MLSASGRHAESGAGCCGRDNSPGPTHPFLEYFTQSILASSNLEYCRKEDMTALYSALVKQILFAAQHDCMRFEQPCIVCEESSRQKAFRFIQVLPKLKEILARDVRAPGYQGLSKNPN